MVYGTLKMNMFALKFLNGINALGELKVIVTDSAKKNPEKEFELWSD